MRAPCADGSEALYQKRKGGVWNVVLPFLFTVRRLRAKKEEKGMGITGAEP